MNDFTARLRQILFPSAVIESYNVNEPVLRYFFSFFLGFNGSVSRHDTQREQRTMSTYHDACPLRKRLYYLFHFVNSSYHNQCNKRETFFVLGHSLMTLF